LDLDPQHEDARFNRDLVRGLMDDNSSRNQTGGDSASHSSQQNLSSSSSSGDRPQQQQAEGQDNTESGAAAKNTIDRGGADQQGTRQRSAQPDLHSTPEKNQGEHGSSPGSHQHQVDGNDQQNEGGQDNNPTLSSNNNRPTTTDAGSNDEKTAGQVASPHQRELQQATRQWLRRIPDDPGGLLKRKFMRDHQARQGDTGSQDPW
jgi:Ca-activated chloride channel family protein